MKFAPGKSGNPRGRPRSTGQAAKLRRAIESDLPEILAAMVAAARGGDVAAAKLLLDRALPALKPVDTPIVLDLGEGLTTAASAILAAVGGGSITPDQGAKVLAALGSAARATEVDELAARIDALEQREHQ